MEKIIGINIEFDGQAWWGTLIDQNTPELALDRALAVIEAEARTGKVTRIEFTYEGDEETP